MRNILLVLGLVIATFAPRLHAQGHWTDTSFTDSRTHEPVYFLANASTDSVVTADGIWKHPSILFMCTPKFDHLLVMVWVGVRPAPSIPDSIDVRILVRVLLSADSSAVTQDVWTAGNKSLIIFPPNDKSMPFFNWVLSSHSMDIAYAQETGGFKKLSFVTDGGQERAKALLKKCPLIILNSIPATN